MSLPLTLLLLVTLSYGQHNTTHNANSSLPSVLVDLVTSAKQEDRKPSEEVTSIFAKIGSEPVTKQTDTSDKAASEPEKCNDSSNGEGVCIPYYKCYDPSLDTETDLIDIPIFLDMPCTSYLDVCCLPENVLNYTTAAPDVVGDQLNKSCGHRNPDGVGLNLTTKLESSVAAFGEFPWIVAVLRIEPVTAEDPEGTMYLGGGSLIHPAVVLTAAHTVHSRLKDSSQNLRVRAGEWDTQTTKEMYQHQDRDVKEVVSHLDFNKNNLKNDIALLFLSTPVDMSAPHIGVVCLPNNNIVDYFSKTPCLASGWGKDHFEKEGRYSVLLKKVELSLVEHETCEEKLRQTRLGARFHLDPSFICAGGEVGKDTCVGDGGGPLVCPVNGNEGVYVQKGLVAWGIGCGGHDIPAAYVNVAKFRRWIDQNVVRRGYDFKIYSLE